jgi:hypothetical protein
MERHLDRPVIVSVKSRVRFALLLLMLFLLLVSLMSCENQNEPQVVARFSFSPKSEAERRELRRDLKQLQSSIDRELEQIRESTMLVDKVAREELFLADRKLKSSRSKIEKALHDMNNCKEADWDRVKMATLQLTQDIETSHRQLAYKFDDIIE